MQKLRQQSASAKEEWYDKMDSGIRFSMLDYPLEDLIVFRRRLVTSKNLVT